MTALAFDGEAFRQRFAFEPFDDGGVLVDLEGGTYFELNGTAAATCETLFETGTEGEAIARLRERLTLDHGQARTLIHSVLADLAEAPVVRAELVGPFRYLRRGEVYVLEDDGRPALEIDPLDFELRVCAGPSSFRFPMLEYVRAVTPKLLGLLGVTVLHASACRWSEQTVGFSGRSGAGKTTTMRAFVAAGAAPISEDLLVLATDHAEATCYLEGEVRAHAWAAEAAARLAQDPAVRIPFAALSAVASGASQIVDQVWFIDPSRRRGGDLTTRRLGGVPGLLALLHNTFLGSASPTAWAKQLRTVRRLSRSLMLIEASTPEGLEPLADGARRYVTKSAS